jgi:hypothetical protein
MVNMPTPHCLSRDFVPWIINQMADPKLVQEVLAQPDYTSFARMVEKTRSFDPPNIHASGHFGVGGILGTMGNAAESPGGKYHFLRRCELALTDAKRPSILPPPRQHRPHLLGVAAERLEDAVESGWGTD